MFNDEWQYAGCIDIPAGPVLQEYKLFNRICFGCDTENLYLRFDINQYAREQGVFKKDFAIYIYIKSLDDNGNENIEYFKQDCEMDAYAFSYAAMHHKYRGTYDSFLYIPKIYSIELKEEFNSAVDDFLKHF